MRAGANPTVGEAAVGGRGPSNPHGGSWGSLWPPTPRVRPVANGAVRQQRQSATTTRTQRQQQTYKLSAREKRKRQHELRVATPRSNKYKQRCRKHAKRAATWEYAKGITQQLSPTGGDGTGKMYRIYVNQLKASWMQRASRCHHQQLPVRTIYVELRAVIGRGYRETVPDRHQGIVPQS